MNERILRVLADHLLIERLTGDTLVGPLSTRVYALHYPHTESPGGTRQHHSRRGLIVGYAGSNLHLPGWPCSWKVTERAMIEIARAGIVPSMSEARARRFILEGQTNIRELHLVE